MLSWAQQHAPVERVWALEGTGSFAAGLAMFLAEAGEQVVEIGGVPGRDHAPGRPGQPHYGHQRTHKLDRGRVRNEAAFAALAGTSPLEASSGQRIRHRLNRGGDLNRALHTVAITRIRTHAETRTYHAKCTADGKTHREIRRSLKRTLARRLYRRMQAATRPPVPPCGS